MIPVDLAATTLVCFLLLRTRLRVQRAPGIPRALSWGRAAPSIGRMIFEELGRTASRECGGTPHRHRPALCAIAYWDRAIQYPEVSVMEAIARGIPDTPLEPVIGLAEGETRWRGMTAGNALCATRDGPSPSQIF